MDLKEKVLILRKHEAYCYQVCYYLTKDEENSVQATRESLIEVFRNPAFFSNTIERQRKIVRTVAVRSSLRINTMKSLNAI
ncbi:hypothetical protein [Bacillus horti]|uniref:Uncharacterized protein n=1 Tax=Caldalkalibacillus horti TaxID=77523 RepID=A0ABT9W456_9BACI|nr:hypothetical protein [Bacillus horti]MDQ0168028.1 hypothetical protein [Bacillus horti]